MSPEPFLPLLVQLVVFGGGVAALWANRRKVSAEATERISAAAATLAEAFQKRVDALEDDNNRLRVRIDSLEMIVANKDSEISALRAERATMADRIEKLETRLRAVEAGC